VEPHQELDERGLSGTILAGERHGPACGDVQIEAPQHRLARDMREGNLFEDDIACDPGGRGAVAEPFGLEHEDPVEALKRSARCLVLTPEPGEPRDRSRQQRGVEQEGDELTGVHRAGIDAGFARPEQRDDRGGRDEEHDRREKRLAPRHQDREPAQLVDMATVERHAFGLAHGGLDRAQHGEVALDRIDELDVGLAPLARDVPERSAEELGEERGERDAHEDRDREQRIERDHQDRRAEERDDLRGDREHGAGQEIAQPLGLVGHDREQVAALALQVEAHRQILDMGVDGFAEVGDDVLGDAGQHEAAHDLEHRLQREERDQARGDPADLEVDIEEEGLREVAQEPGHGEKRGGLAHHQEHAERELDPVGPGVAEDRDEGHRSPPQSPRQSTRVPRPAR